MNTAIETTLNAEKTAQTIMQAQGKLIQNAIRTAGGPRA